jgi:hypothetical protein
MDLDKIHQIEKLKRETFDLYYIQELEEWIRSMVLLPEEFEFQKNKIYKKITEKIMEESGW